MPSGLRKATAARSIKPPDLEVALVGTHPGCLYQRYSREDSEFALRLAEDLKAAGASVWLDQLSISSPARPWDSAIEERR